MNLNSRLRETMSVCAILKRYLLLSAALLVNQAMAQSMSNVNEAMQDLFAGKPIPGLPNLNKPVFLAPNSFVCSSRGALANPNKDILLKTRDCVLTEKKIRVSVVQPRTQDDYIEAHVARVIKVMWQSSAISDATVYSGWTPVAGITN
jgi:hypothetical protein